MHTVESAAIVLEASKCRRTGGGRGGWPRAQGVGLEGAIVDRPGGLTGARVTLRTLRRGELSAPTLSSESFRAVARQGDKQLKIYSTCFLSKHRHANTDARRILISPAFPCLTPGSSEFRATLSSGSSATPKPFHRASQISLRCIGEIFTLFALLHGRRNYTIPGLKLGFRIIEVNGFKKNEIFRNRLALIEVRKDLNRR